jgi:hypothetical protein
MKASSPQIKAKSNNASLVDRLKTKMNLRKSDSLSNKNGSKMAFQNLQFSCILSTGMNSGSCSIGLTNIHPKNRTGVLDTLIPIALRDIFFTGTLEDRDTRSIFSYKELNLESIFKIF